MSLHRPTTVAALAGRSPLPWLMLAIALGLALAIAFWATDTLDASFVKDWQHRVIGARNSAGIGIAVGTALLVGATMVVLPCGFPAVFAVPTILERERRTSARFRALAAFALGGALPLAAAGAILGLAGGGLWDAFDSPTERTAFTAVLYSLLGAIAILYGLAGLGVLSVRGVLDRLPALNTTPDSGIGRHAFVLGGTFGAGIGIACPMPTYYALLSWVALAGSPWYGALVLGFYGLGRVLPPIVLGLLIIGGASRRSVSTRLVAARAPIEAVSSHLILAMGVFVIVLFGGFNGLGQI